MSHINVEFRKRKKGKKESRLPTVVFGLVNVPPVDREYRTRKIQKVVLLKCRLHSALFECTFFAVYQIRLNSVMPNVARKRLEFSLPSGIYGKVDAARSYCDQIYYLQHPVSRLQAL